MKLWTVQPMSVFNLIEEKGFYHCDEKYFNSFRDGSFIDAYNWLVDKMKHKIGNAPDGVKYPVWAWYKQDGKSERPDLDETGYAESGTQVVCMELEVPDELVVLSDFNNWHYVLNKWYCDESNNEEEWEEIRSWYDGLSPEKRDEEMISSWDNIFNVEYRKDEWRSNGLYVQATFWEIKKEYIKNLWIFDAK